MRPALLLLCLSLIACRPAQPPQVDIQPPKITLPAAVRELTPAEAADWLAQTPDVTLMDMRMPEETTREGSIAGSKNYDYLQTKTFEELARQERQKPYLIYCTLGGRAQLTAIKLHELGFTRLTVLKGGINAWFTEGKPVVK